MVTCIVDTSVAVNVGRSHHLVEIVHWESDSELLHGLIQLRLGDVAVAVPVKHLCTEFATLQVTVAQLTELWFYVPLDTKYVISETFPPSQSLGFVWKKRRKRVRKKWRKKDKWGSIRYKQHTHICLMALFPGLSSSAGTRKVKLLWILLKQETVSGSGISWAYASLHIAPDR